MQQKILFDLAMRLEDNLRPMANWAWPEIIDEESARGATHRAGGWAAFVAGLTTLFAIVNMVTSVSVFGIGPWSLVDAALFAVVAWRIWCGSRAFAVAGLSLYCLEVLYGVVTHPPGVGILRHNAGFDQWCAWHFRSLQI